MLIVYSKKNCPACDQAKKYLSTKHVDFSEVKIDEIPDARDFLLSRGHRSVPQIYKDDKLFVGSVAELISLPEQCLS